MDDIVRELARAQDGVLARFQLLERGMSPAAIAHRVRRLRAIHPGVYLTGEARITRQQRRRAATLHVPGSALAFASAGDAWGFRPWEGGFEIVVRPGSGGPERHRDLLICRSTRVDGDGGLLDVTALDGVPITTPERSIADLWPRLRTEPERRKMLREALRLERTTVTRLRMHLATAPRRCRPRELTKLLDRYVRLDLRRCRSDAEARAVELIDAAGLPPPRINVRIAGLEADLSWPEARLVIEIDGTQFHIDKVEDARRTAVWTEAGWTVRRVPADLVFLEPDAFIAALRRHLEDASGAAN